MCAHALSRTKVEALTEEVNTLTASNTQLTAALAAADSEKQQIIEQSKTYINKLRESLAAGQANAASQPQAAGGGGAVSAEFVKQLIKSVRVWNSSLHDAVVEVVYCLFQAMGTVYGQLG